MKKLFLILSILGYIAPNIWVVMVSVETGNMLLWTDPVATAQGMFNNDISTAFTVEILFVVAVVMLWMFVEAKRVGMNKPYYFYLLIWLFGLSGTLPLFLYFRQGRLEAAQS